MELEGKLEVNVGISAIAFAKKGSRHGRESHL